ncbi:MAG: UDP-N-acetylmuramoyl-tripeptide--D-alanyl-D-alanine ligase [Candidatus Omnitrophota bacterium]
MFRVGELLKATQGRLLSRGNKDVTVKGISLDSRTIRPGQAFLAIKGDNFDGHDFIKQVITKGAKCIILAAGSRQQAAGNIPLIEVKDTTKALADIARHHRSKFDIPVIAVTGSNGKTTTKEMIAWVLAKRFKVLKNEGTKNNHIGLPQTLLNLDSTYGVGVVELGTNHFGEIENLTRIANPNIGIITNIGASHLEFLRDSHGVFREKYSLIENLANPRLAILNADDGFLRKEVLNKKKSPLILGFGIKTQADFRAVFLRRRLNKIEFYLGGRYKFCLNTVGFFNIYNALACIAVARVLGMSYTQIGCTLGNFQFPQGRLKIYTFNSAIFIDDTYNSNPLSLSVALDTLQTLKAKGRRVMVMGDMKELGRDEEEFHLEAGKRIARACDTFIAVGRLSGLALEAAAKNGLARDSLYRCRNAAQARDILFKRISPGKNDVVLIKGSRAMKMEEVLK